MGGARLARGIAAQQHGLHEGALLRADGRVRIAEDDAAISRDFRDLGAHVLALRGADERAHFGRFVARVADRHFLKARFQSILRRVHEIGRHERAANGGALLPSFHGHFAHDLFDEEIELGGIGRGVGAEHGGVE